MIFVKKNLGFEVTNKYASWGDYCYSSSIASIILLLSSEYETCFMPSCNDYSVLVPRGSHILINHLWGCDGVEFIYDGAEASRVEKVDYIVDNKIVQNHLRVCYKSNDDYNCSQCEKCIRTMASLEAINKLSKVKTFSKPLIVDNISQIEFHNDSEQKMAEATMNVAIKNNKVELAEQLRKQILNYKLKSINNEIEKDFNVFVNMQDFSEIENKIFDWIIENDTKRSLKKLISIILKKLKTKLCKK